MQFNNFETLVQTTNVTEAIFSPRLYSTGGYAYRVGILLWRPNFGVIVQLLSGENDERLEWPCLQRQVTFTMLDQTSNIQQHMSKQRSFTSDLSTLTVNGNKKKLETTFYPFIPSWFACNVLLFLVYVGTYLWGNPREVGHPFTDKNNETVYAGPLLGFQYFSSLTEIREREFVKGGSVVFTFKFDGRLTIGTLQSSVLHALFDALWNICFPFPDLTPLVNGSELPCPLMSAPKVSRPNKTSSCFR